MTAFTCGMCKADLGVRRLAGACPKCGAKFSPAGVWSWLQHAPLMIVVVGILLVSPITQAVSRRPFGVGEYTILFVAIVTLSVAISIFVLRKARHKWAAR